MEKLYPPSIFNIVDNLFSYPYLSNLGGFGMMMTHRQAAVFTARRLELCDVVESTLVYLRPDSRVHSYLSPLPYQRCVNYDMPRLFAFDLIRETDQEFEARVGWVYSATSPIQLPAMIHVLPHQ